MGVIPKCVAEMLAQRAWTVKKI